MVAIFSVIILFCAVSAILDWRKGIYACVVAALVQDPLRKLLPEEPVYLTLIAAIVLSLAAARAFSNGVNFKLRQITGWSHRLGTPFLVLMLWIVIQTLNSLVTIGNPLVTAVGLATYIAPIPALILGYQFALRAGPEGVQDWLRFYLVLVGSALSTVFLEYTGLESDLFGQVGEGMKVYDLGTVLIGKTGIFRSTEVAAWHATAAACFAFIVLTSSKINNRRIIIAVVVVAIMVAISVLTGRRKSIMAVAIFATTYLFLFALLYKDVQNWLLGLIAVSATLFLIFGGILHSETASHSDRALEYQLFLERGAMVFEDAPDRVLSMTLGQAKWATRTTGILGAGVGVATSGARHVSSIGQQFGGAGEGGIGKLLVELGIPGLILIGWFMLVLVRHFWRILRYTARRSSSVFRLSAGLVAFLVANGMIFVVNTQIFSDFFVLIVFGLTLGFLLAMPALAKRSITTVPNKAATATLRATARH